MRVILLERIPKLGQMGDIVEVKPGFARNYLIPQGKALRATEEAIQAFEKRRKQLEARNLERKQEAEQLAARIAGRHVTIIRQASDSGALYGSVNARDIAAAFAEDGLNLDRRQVLLTQPLKSLGVHRVTLQLHPEVEVEVTVNVARSPEEAETQLNAAQLLERPPAAEERDEETGGAQA